MKGGNSVGSGVPSEPGYGSWPGLAGDVVDRDVLRGQGIRPGVDPHLGLMCEE